MNNRIIYCILLIFLPSNFIQHWNLCWFIFVCFCLLLHLHWHGISSNKSDTASMAPKIVFLFNQLIAYSYTFMIYYRVLSSIFSNHIHACWLSKSKGFFIVYINCVKDECRTMFYKGIFGLLPFLLLFFLFVLFSVSYVWKKEKAIYGKVIE